MIKNIDFGKHKGVQIAEFGSGDIRISLAVEQGYSYANLLVLSNEFPARSIGEVVVGDGRSSDDIEAPMMVLTFSKPESITTLIHSLIELQEELFLFSNKQII